jgi:hypothetical protein
LNLNKFFPFQTLTGVLLGDTHIPGTARAAAAAAAAVAAESDYRCDE